MMALAQRLRVKHSSSKLVDASELARAHDHHAPPTELPLGNGHAAGRAVGEPEAEAEADPPSPPPAGERAKRRSVDGAASRLAERPTPRQPSARTARAPSASHVQQLLQHQHAHQQRAQPVRPHAKTSAEPPSPALARAQRPRQHSTASMSGWPHAGLGLDRSTVASSTSSGSSARSDKPERAVDVLMAGTLALRRGGLLKAAPEKRYYFLARARPELFCCKDETSFQLWLASGHALDAGDAFGRANGLNPVVVCTVLRADPGDQAGTARDRSLSVVASAAAKCTTLRFQAESSELAARWVAALREVQVTQSRPRDARLPSAADKKLLLPLQTHEQLRRKSSDVGASATTDGAPHALQRRTSASSSSSGSSAAKTPSDRPTGRAQGRALSTSGAAAATATATTTEQPPSEAATRVHRMDSNVVLFVPAADSSISVSDAKLARAKQELAALVARGGKRPSRRGGRGESGDDDAPAAQDVAWRFGPPEYALSDLEYVRGKQREHEATPLESYVEECCQTLLMEATHKAEYAQWRSVVHDAFSLQVNDGARVRGRDVRHTDMFGLLYLAGVDLSDLDPAAISTSSSSSNTNSSHSNSHSNVSEDPRAVLTEAFADGFPMEVVEVFTQPPQCYFSWRHWGRFTGKFGGVRGDGARVEVRGFGQMTVDAGAMRDLRLFFKQKELFVKLQAEAQRIASARAAAVGANGSADGRAIRSMSLASVATSANGAVPPPPPSAPPSAASSQSPAPTPSPGAGKTVKTHKAPLKTDDIIAGLADFTLESKQSRKQMQ